MFWHDHSFKRNTNLLLSRRHDILHAKKFAIAIILIRIILRQHSNFCWRRAETYSRNRAIADRFARTPQAAAAPAPRVVRIEPGVPPPHRPSPHYAGPIHSSADPAGTRGRHPTRIDRVDEQRSQHSRIAAGANGEGWSGGAQIPRNGPPGKPASRAGVGETQVSGGARNRDSVAERTAQRIAGVGTRNVPRPSGPRGRCLP